MKLRSLSLSLALLLASGVAADAHAQKSTRKPAADTQATALPIWNNDGKVEASAEEKAGLVEFAWQPRATSRLACQITVSAGGKQCTEAAARPDKLRLAPSALRVRRGDGDNKRVRHATRHGPIVPAGCDGAPGVPPWTLDPGGTREPPLRDHAPARARAPLRGLNRHAGRGLRAPGRLCILCISQQHS